MVWPTVQVHQIGGSESPMAVGAAVVLKESWLALILFVDPAQERGIPLSMKMVTVQALEQRRSVLMITIGKLAQITSLKWWTVQDTVEERAPCQTMNSGPFWQV